MTLSVAVVVVLAAVVVIAVWPDPRLSADETASQLRARVGVDWAFVCSPEENDGTITGMDDVDYFCQPADAAHVEETGYWVGTDDSRIVAIQPAG